MSSGSSLVAAVAALGIAACAGSANTADRGYQTIVSSSDLSGKRVGADASADATVIIVFASWCYPCRKELAVLKEVHAARPATRFIGVNAFEEFDDLGSEAKLRAYLADNHPWLQVVRAGDGTLRAFGGVEKIPTLFVYDRNGRKVKAFRRSQRRAPGKRELLEAISAAANGPRVGAR